MSKSITVPTGMKPLEIMINRRRYVLTPGTTVTVPDEVAELLANNAANAPQQAELAEENIPLIVTFTLDDETLVPDVAWVLANVKWRKGKLVYGKIGEKIYLPVQKAGSDIVLRNVDVDADEGTLVVDTIFWSGLEGPTENVTMYTLTEAEEASGTVV